MSDLNSRATVELDVNGKNAKAELESLIKQARDYREAMSKAAREGDNVSCEKWRKELRKVERDIRSVQSATRNVADVMKRLDKATPDELRKTLSTLNKQLKQMTRGTQEWTDQAEKIRKVKAELQSVNDELKVHESLWTKTKNLVNSWQTTVVAAVMGINNIIGAGKDAVNAYAEIEQEMANVRKYTGMTEEQVKDLNEEFKKIDTRTGRIELNKLAEEAGRLGKSSKEDVLGFVRAANVINVALDELGDGATLTLSKLTGIFGDEAKYGTEQSLLKVGAIVNELSQNCRASAPYLVEFASRMGGVGAQANMTAAEIMGFGAVMDSYNLKVEASATALSQVIMRLYQDPAKYAKVAGLDVKQFAELLKKDANEAVLTLLEALKKSGGLDTLAPMFQDMGENGARAIQTLASLSEHIEEVRQRQAEATVAFNEGTSAVNEYNIQNETVQAKLEKARNGLADIRRELGEQLLPVMTHCVSGSTMLLKALSALISTGLKYKNTLIALTVSIVAIYTAFQISAIKAKALNLVLKICGVDMAAWNVAVSNGTRLTTLWNGALSQGTKGIKALGAAIKANPIGLLITGIAAAITAITAFIDKNREATEEAERQRVELENWKKSLTDLTEESAQYAAKEKTNLDMLYEAATNENLARGERLKAVEKLKKQYPSYFKHLSNEAIMAGKARGEYNKLANSIMAVAEARAAYNRIVKNMELKLELSQKLDHAKNAAQGWKDRANRYDADLRMEGGDINDNAITSFFKGTGDLKGEVDYSLERMRFWNNQVVEIQSQINDVDKSIEDLHKKYDQTIKKYNITEGGDDFSSFDVDKTPSVNWTKPAAHESASEKKEREKRESEQAKAEAAAKKALKDRLGAEEATAEKEAKIEFDRYEAGEITYAEYIKRKEKIDLDYIEQALKTLREAGYADTKTYADMLKQREQIHKNMLERIQKEEMISLRKTYEEQSRQNKDDIAQGRKDYLQYLAEQKRLDTQYYDDRLKLLKDAGLEESKEYLDLLKGKAEMLEKYEKKARDRSAKAMEQEHERLSRQATEDFYTPGNALYQNEEALRLRLLKLDTEYYETMRDSYTKYTEEWEQWDAKLNDRLAEDRLARQQQTHEKMLEYSAEYRTKDREARMEAEKAILKRMHDDGLLTEKQYQEALAALRKKFREEESAEASKVTSEYGDMVKKVYETFVDLFDNLNVSSEDFWERLAAAAESAFAMMSAGLSQYTSFANAERDLELAKVEQRYKAEVEAAGNNSKKKERIEKKKEAATAKIKQKYNERAMKVELAQAYAQTALAAISAYASASKVAFWLGPVAAAMALAAGAIQIATIKKQHEAEAIGYSEGGFTRPGRKNEEAGVVHAGEWVASQKLVNSPVTRPIIDALEKAQRTNTIGSLAVAAPTPIIITQTPSTKSDEAVAANTEIIAQTTSSIKGLTISVEELNRQLAEGIKAPIYLDGPNGLNKRLEDYKKLKNAPKP